MSKPSKSQLAANVVPVVREYIDAAMDDALMPLVSDIRILHERINTLAGMVNNLSAEANAAQKSLEMKMDLMRKG